MTPWTRFRAWMKRNNRRIHATDLVFLIVLAGAFWLLVRPLHRTPFGYDENWFVWGGWGITAGQTPYVDFTDFKPPMGFLVNAAGLAVFGLDALAYRYVVAILVFCGLALLYVAMRSRGHAPLLALGVTSLILYLIADQRFHDNSLNDVESIGFGFFMCGLSLLLMAGSSRWRSAAGGAMLAAAVMTKEPFVLSALPSFAACFFLRVKSTRRESVQMAMWGIAGGAAFGLALVAYLVAVGGFGAYLDVVASYRRFADEYCVSLGIFQRSTFIGEFRQSFFQVHQRLLNWQILATLSPFLGLGLVATFILRRVGALLSVLAVVGGLYSATLGHCFWTHYFVMAFGSLALLSVVGADLIAARSSGWFVWPVRVALILLMAYALGPRVAQEITKRYPVPGPFFAPDVVQFIRETTSPTDRIFTTGEPAIYAYTERQSALTNGSYVDEFLAYLPGNTDQEKVAPAFAELMRKKPKVVFFESVLPEERKQRYTKALFLPYVQAMGYREARPGIFVLP
jgi:hypothetical protein